MDVIFRRWEARGNEIRAKSLGLSPGDPGLEIVADRLAGDAAEDEIVRTRTRLRPCKISQRRKDEDFRPTTDEPSNASPSKRLARQSASGELSPGRCQRRPPRVRLRRQSAAAGLAQSVATQIAGHQA